MPAIDTYANRPGFFTAPWSNIAAVTPNDATDLTYVTRALWIGVAGNLRVTAVDGGIETFLNVPAGVFVGRISRVHSTGTTATGIIALW